MVAANYGELLTKWFLRNIQFDTTAVDAVTLCVRMVGLSNGWVSERYY